jgi:hypothetical protein
VKLTTHLHLVPKSRMRGAIHPLPQYVFMVWCLVKHRDNFTEILFNNFIFSVAFTVKGQAKIKRIFQKVL